MYLFRQARYVVSRMSQTMLYTTIHLHMSTVSFSTMARVQPMVTCSVRLANPTCTLSWLAWQLAVSVYRLHPSYDVHNMRILLRYSHVTYFSRFVFQFLRWREDKPPTTVTTCVVSGMTSTRLNDDTGLVHSTGRGAGISLFLIPLL